jgi:fibronectin-binding autotransporter adhesin
MKNALIMAPVVLLALAASSLKAQTWNWVPTTGDGLWNDPSKWTDGGSNTTIPNTTGAAVIVPAPTGTRTLTLSDGAGCTAQGGCNFTVGSISLTNTAALTTTIRNNSTNTAGVASLIFDAAGAGPATITVNSTGATTNQSLITADMVFTDTVDVNVVTDVGNSSAGAISLTGNMTGPGGLIKDGPGEMTMAFVSGQTSQVKQYTGATIINNGRWRHSVGGTPTMTSSVTVNNGGQITMITNASTYTYGTSAATPLNLNGFGPTTGAFSPFPGAIRPDTNLSITIANNIVLQSAAMIHSQGSASGSITLPGIVSGRGILVAGSVPHDANVGKIVLQNTNTYTGGTIVNVGTLVADSASTRAFGTGTVQVVSANAVSGGSQAHVQIVPGAADAIANTSYLNLAGGGAAGVADDGYIDLGDSSVNETIAGLMLGGAIQIAGTYGSTSSSATFQNDEYFAGSGILTVTGATVPGDYNNNGVVDAADEVLWRKGGPLANDFTPGVQASDYDFWRSRFGATTNPGRGSGLGASTVPEPSTIALAGCIVSLLAFGRRRKSVHVSLRETSSPFIT